MPRFFFNLSCDEFDAEDLEGQECRDLEEARADALVAAGELIRLEMARGGIPRSGWIEIQDALRRRIATLPLRAAAC